MKFIIEKYNLDEDGLQIMPGAIKGLPVSVPVLINYQSEKVVGEAIVTEEDGMLVANVSDEVVKDHLYKFPGIGFTMIRWEQSPFKKVIEARLFCVGLSDGPNSDSSISSLADQIKTS